MTADTKFKVCRDPTVYDVESLGQWVFVQHKRTYPHNRQPIPPADIAYLQKKWEKLHPPRSPSPENGMRDHWLGYGGTKKQAAPKEKQTSKHTKKSKTTKKSKN